MDGRKIKFQVEFRAQRTTVAHGYLLVCFAFALLLPGYSQIASPLDQDRLWLPISYQARFLQLKEAALKAEALDRCEFILEGTIALQKSSHEHPVFRFLCRQPNGKTYSELVDGLSMETLTTPVVVELPPTEEELARLRIEEERKRVEELQLKKQELWNLCEKVFTERTRLMINPVRLHEGRPEPDPFLEELAKYVVDFDADSLSGGKLRFRATCLVKSGTEVEFRLGARPENEDKSNKPNH